MNKKFYQVPSVEVIEIEFMELLAGSTGTETLDGFLQQLQDENAIVDPTLIL